MRLLRWRIFRWLSWLWLRGRCSACRSYEELAEALSLRLGTVKTHLHRAKRQLRHLLETEYR